MDDDTLSPELALVDPDMNLRARLALPDMTLTESQIAAARIPTPSYEDIRRVFRESVDVEPSRRRWRGPSMLAALAIVVAAAATALAVPRELTSREASTSLKSLHPAAATHHSVQKAHHGRAKAKSAAGPKVLGKARSRPATSHSASTHVAKASAKVAVAAPASRRRIPQHTRKTTRVRKLAPAIPDFAWAPAKGVSGYLVEFRAGSKIVLRTQTRAAKLHVSAKALRPGTYRWVVWGLNSRGAPTGKPLVDSSVRIRRG